MTIKQKSETEFVRVVTYQIGGNVGARDPPSLHHSPAGGEGGEVIRKSNQFGKNLLTKMQ